MAKVSKAKKTGNMYTVQVERRLCFAPLMNEQGEGVRVVRTYELPFPPYPGLRLPKEPDCTIEECPQIEAVMWDSFTERFEADAGRDNHYLSISDIAIRLALSHQDGWTIEQRRHPYNVNDAITAAPPSAPRADTYTDYGDWDDDLYVAAPETRPTHFNAFLDAFVRLMVDARNNRSTAYAIDQTGRYFDGKPAEPEFHEAWQRWETARQQYEHMTVDQRASWMTRTQQYLHMNSVLAG